MEDSSSFPIMGTVTESYAVEFSIFVTMKMGEELRWERRQTPFEGWLFCTNSQGVSGWVPEKYLDIQDEGKNACTALRDYTARELAVSQGENLLLFDLEAEWYWAVRLNGEDGWVPAQNVRVIRAPLPPVFTAEKDEVRHLYPENREIIQELFEKCVEYSLIVTGELPDAQEAENFLLDTPPGRDRKCKWALGVFQEGRLVGLLDAVKGYPEEDTWFIGLFLLDPAVRGKGLGKEIITSFEKWVRTLGGQKLKLGVVEDNRQAMFFWEGIGFEKIEIRAPRQFGSKEQKVFLYQKIIQE